MTMMPTTTEWQPTACILCECNCGVEVQLEGRTLAKIRGDKAHPGSQGYTCNKAMRLDHYQNGRHRLDVAAAPARRTARFEEIDWDTAISEVAAGFKRIAGRARRRVDLLLRRRRSGQPPRRRLRRRVPEGARLALPLERARPGEDRRGMGRRPALRRPHPRRVRARRGRGLRRQEPVDVAELPAGPRGAARDREGPRAVDDRDRPGRDRHGQARRLPSARPAGQPTPGASPRSAPRSSRRTSSTTAFIDEHVNGSEPVLAALAEVPIADYAERCGVDEDADQRAPPGASPRRRQRRACSRTSASSRRRTAPCAPT